MKIQKLSIEGFRSLKKIEWTPGDLNVVIGQNASGKSNLIAALEMLSASARGRLSEYVISKGGMTSLVWDGQAQGVRFASEISFDKDAHETQFDTFEYKLDMRRRGAANDYFLTDEFVVVRHLMARLNGGPNFTNLLTRDIQSAMLFFDKSNDFEVVHEVSPAETLLSLASGAYGGNRWLPLLRKYLAEWSLYNDLFTHQNALIRQSVITRYDTRISPDGQNLASVLHTLYANDRDFKREIDLGMGAAFDDFEEVVFLPASSQRIELGVRWKSLKSVQTAASLSDGTLRFLFLLTVLSDPNPPALIAIDEPETGLHPRMLPIVAEFAADAARQTQIVFTTHSDSFLSAFRDIQPTTTVVSQENGETKLDVLDNSQLEYWLKEYTLGELYETGQLESMV